MYLQCTCIYMYINMCTCRCNAYLPLSFHLSPLFFSPTPPPPPPHSRSLLFFQVLLVVVKLLPQLSDNFEMLITLEAWQSMQKKMMKVCLHVHVHVDEFVCCTADKDYLRTIINVCIQQSMHLHVFTCIEVHLHTCSWNVKQYVLQIFCVGKMQSHASVYV